jgi:hypothetical protein
VFVGLNELRVKDLLDALLEKLPSEMRKKSGTGFLRDA